jgi:hypothetical protein
VIAQTNVQLYRQLRDAGVADDELARVRAAYELGVELFSGRYRRPHRPFIEHLVGTASIVADVDGRPSMVLAALLHAAYPRGDWGGRAAGARERDAVRRVVGPEAEALIWQYAQIPSKLDALELWVEGHRHAPSPLAADLVVLALANQVEELQDQPEEDPVPPTIKMLVDAAKDLGADEIGTQIVDISTETASLRLPSALEGPPYPGYVLLPRSARRLLRLRIRRALRRPTWRGIVRRLERSR